MIYRLTRGALPVQTPAGKRAAVTVTAPVLQDAQQAAAGVTAVPGDAGELVPAAAADAPTGVMDAKADAAGAA